MYLINLDDLKSLGPRVSVIWSGASTECRSEAPLFAIGSASQKFIDHHKNSHALLTAPAVYAIDGAEVHGLGAVCWDNLVLGGDGWPGLSSLTTPAPRFFGQSAKDYFQNVASGRRRRRIDGAALLLARPGDHIYGHWLIDIFPIVWLTIVRAGFRPKYILRDGSPEYAVSWLRATGASTSDIIFYDPKAEILEVERLLVAPGLRRGDFLHPAFKEYRDWFETVAGLRPTEPRGGDRRIYISRREWKSPNRQLLNRDTIEAQFLKRGFDVYQPEKEPLQRQIATFRQARLIAGEFGSGLHNNIFSGPGMIMGVLVGENRWSLHQSSLCVMFGQKIAYATGEAFLRPNFREFKTIAPYVIAPEVIDEFLNRLDASVK
jgi:glycosyl transferase family 61